MHIRRTLTTQTLLKLRMSIQQKASLRKWIDKKKMNRQAIDWRSYL